MIVIGAVIGIGVSTIAGRVLEAPVEGIRRTDPLTDVSMVSMLAAAALFASFIPARRVDPVKPLRQE